MATKIIFYDFLWSGEGSLYLGEDELSGKGRRRERVKRTGQGRGGKNVNIRGRDFVVGRGLKLECPCESFVCLSPKTM